MQISTNNLYNLNFYIVVIIVPENTLFPKSTEIDWSGLQKPQNFLTTSLRNRRHCESLVFHFLGDFRDIPPFLLDCEENSRSLVFIFVFLISILASFQQDHHSNYFSLEAYLARPIKDCVPKSSDSIFNFLLSLLKVGIYSN